MRIRDSIYEKDWKRIISTVSGMNLVLASHHLFGVLALATIILQSAISLNIYIFVIWLVLSLVLLFMDLFRGTNLSLSFELGFGFFITFGTILSLLFANFNSIFFLSTLGRWEIICYQIFIGLCLALRFLSTFFYIEFFTHDKSFITPQSPYAKEQLTLFKENLIKTDYEQKLSKKISLIQKWWFLTKQQFWSFIIMVIFVLLALIYSFVIYLVIPSNTIAEFVLRPSLIIMAILYSILSIRAYAQLPKLEEGKAKQKIDANLNEKISELSEH
ncbi:MAG: hypothetical protein ACTSSF_02955 [Candidatus Heimdallarchaeaceae archaeon]